MKVNAHLIDRYIWRLTNSAVASQDDPMEDLSDYEPEINDMLRSAREAGDEDILRLSIDALLANPAGRITDFNGGVYAYDEEDMVALLTHACAHAWPDAMRSLPGEEPQIEFVPMSDEEWAIRRGRS